MIYEGMILTVPCEKISKISRDFKNLENEDENLKQKRRKSQEYVLRMKKIDSPKKSYLMKMKA